MSRVYDVFLPVRAWLHDEGESPMTPDYIDDILARTAVSQAAGRVAEPLEVAPHANDRHHPDRAAHRVAGAHRCHHHGPRRSAWRPHRRATGWSRHPHRAIPASSAVPSPTAASSQSLDGRLPPLHGPAANGLIAFTRHRGRLNGPARARTGSCAAAQDCQTTSAQRWTVATCASASWAAATSTMVSAPGSAGGVSHLKDGSRASSFAVAAVACSWRQPTLEHEVQPDQVHPHRLGRLTPFDAGVLDHVGIGRQAMTDRRVAG